MPGISVIWLYLWHFATPPPKLCSMVNEQARNAQRESSLKLPTDSAYSVNGKKCSKTIGWHTSSDIKAFSSHKSVFFFKKIVLTFRNIDIIIWMETSFWFGSLLSKYQKFASSMLKANSKYIYKQKSPSIILSKVSIDTKMRNFYSF